MDHYKPHQRAIRSQSSAIVVAIMLVSLIGCHSAGTSQNIQGVQQFQYGQPQAAIQHFEKALADNPTNPDAFYNLGATYHYVGKQQSNQ